MNTIERVNQHTKYIGVCCNMANRNLEYSLVAAALYISLSKTSIQQNSLIDVEFGQIAI